MSSVIVKQCGICQTKDNGENMAECLRCGNIYCEPECHGIHTG